MKFVPLHKLEGEIIRPGFEDHLKPLLRFRGNATLGRVHRMWNVMVSGMLHEATTADITQRLVHNENFSQLCGPENKITLGAIRGFTGRLMAKPEVLDELPILREYIEDLLPWYRAPLKLTPWREPPESFVQMARGKSVTWAMEAFGAEYRIVRRWFDEAGIAPTHGATIPLPKQWQSFAARERNWELARRFEVGMQTIARWRAETGIVCLAPSRPRVSADAIVYPFVIHDGGKPEHALLRKVNAAVPKHFDPETRADICQDLVVGILCGEFSEDDLSLPAKEMTRRVMKMFPTKYGPISLDEIMPGTDDFRLIDTISNEDSLWERI
jgi:hypothetical protein